MPKKSKEKPMILGLVFSVFSEKTFFCKFLNFLVETFGDFVFATFSKNTPPKKNNNELPDFRKTDVEHAKETSFF